MLSAVVDVCSRARSLEAGVTPTDICLPFNWLERSSTVAVHESLGLECVDCREIIFDPGGVNAPARKSVQTALRSVHVWEETFLEFMALGLSREDSILCARFSTRAGRNSFLIEVTYNYVNACWTWRGVND